jgi:hypothetical protein
MLSISFDALPQRTKHVKETTGHEVLPEIHDFVHTQDCLEPAVKVWQYSKPAELV